MLLVPSRICRLMIDAYNRGRDLHINRASSFFDMLHASRQPHLFLVLFFGGVSFSEYLCTIIPLFPFFLVLYGEYVARFPIPDGVFLPCDHGPEF